MRFRKSSSSDTNIKMIGTMLLLALLLGGCFGSCAIYRASAEDRTIIVTEKERVTQNTEDGVTSKYLVFTNDRTYEVVDTYSFMRFNSSDIYGRLRQNHKYKVKVAGWRMPFLSWYENIITIHSDMGDVTKQGKEEQ